MARRNSFIPMTVLGLQGLLNTTIGLYGLLSPEVWRSQLMTNFGGVITSPAGYTTSLQLLNMGVLTVLTATQSSLHRPALATRACLHLVAGWIFLGEGEALRGAAMADFGFAGLNTIVLGLIVFGCNR